MSNHPSPRAGTVRVPAPRPCGSCPYRCDVPPGVWDAVEYAKLPAFDGPTYTQPPSVFLCHQEDGRLCAGWAAVHDMADSLGLRLAVSRGDLTPAEVQEVIDYETDVPLFESGAEAAAYGVAAVSMPPASALRVIEKLRGKVKSDV